MTNRNAVLLAAVLLCALAGPLVYSQAPGQPPQAAASQAPSQQPGKQEQVIRVPADFVSVVFAVVSRRQRFITDLARENFKVFEDNQEQRIEMFGRQTDLPLRVGLLLDTSNSIRSRFKFEQEAARDFFHNNIRRKRDLAFLMIFDNEPSVVQEFTDDAGQLGELVQKQRPGGGTALYDAIYNACKDRLATAPLAPGENPEVRRVLVLFSDGEDSLSERSRREAIEMAQKAEVAIYTISTSREWLTAPSGKGERERKPEKYFTTEGDKLLEELAEETGGRAFFPYHVDDLGQSFRDIEIELRSQYSLGYVPTNRDTTPGKFRKIKIEVDRKGLQVRGRRGYFVPRLGGAVPAAVPTK